jgi:hypothetical protein
VDQVLINGSQFASQQIVQDVEDFLVALHGVLQRSWGSGGWLAKIGWLAHAGILGQPLMGLKARV